MKKGRLSRRVTKRVYLVARWGARLLGGLIVLLICAFFFLRVYGVPKFFLREIIKRANAAGVPLDIEEVTLSLRGWRAENVRLYGNDPDDLKPILEVKELLLARKTRLDDEEDAWVFDLEARDIDFNPAVDWSLEIPEGSAVRRVEGARVTLEFKPGRVSISRGLVRWLDVDFEISGVLSGFGATRKPAEKTVPRDVEPVDEKSVPRAEEHVAEKKAPRRPFLTEERFRLLENRLKSLRIDGPAKLALRFDVDLNEPLASSLDVNFKVEDFSFRNVPFSALNVSGAYRFPMVTLRRAELRKDGSALNLTGEYDLESGLVRGGARNGIVSKKMLLLAPQNVMDILVKAELLFEELPRFQINFGPARLADLHNHLTGSFSINEVSYRKLEIVSMGGDLTRANDRLDLRALNATVRGQEERSAETGSCMIGGSATGSVFWDWSTHEFGVKAAGSFDPHLVVRPLDLVMPATNAINRFKFLEKPPRIELSLGSCYTNWTDFYIDISAAGNEVRFHDADLSSINATARYQHAVLVVEPLAVMKDVDFLKGAVTILFREQAAEFDAFGTIPPEHVEDGAYPGFNLFGNKITTEGESRLSMRGRVEWDTMRSTDFSAEIEADRVGIPVADFTDFKAVVRGDGPWISVTNANFGVCGGRGAGSFAIRVDPATNALPYAFDISIDDAAFGRCLARFREGVDPEGVKGILSASARVEADMRHDFFKDANGFGRVMVEDGQLTDLPLFSGFSRLVRHVIPGFSVFSITKLTGDFELEDGVILSENAYFEGDLISAKGRGAYSTTDGFDAVVQAQVLRDTQVARLFRFITDPIFKLFEMRLTGSLSEPEWRLDKLPPATLNER